MTTIITRQLHHLSQRQDKTERELALLKKAVLMDEERFIHSAILKKWERISRNLDRQKGRSFSSMNSMRKWLKNI